MIFSAGQYQPIKKYFFYVSSHRRKNYNIFIADIFAWVVGGGEYGILYISKFFKKYVAVSAIYSFLFLVEFLDELHLSDVSTKVKLYAEFYVNALKNRPCQVQNFA